ncbi:MAG: hypothetical protein ACI4JX_07070, partial [Oscillospiraceae bacterium]
MKSFCVAADSGCDLPIEFFKENGAYPIHMEYLIGTDVFFDLMTESDIKEFYKKTGLKLSIIYIKDLCNEVSFNELGSSIDTIFNNTVYNHDLLVIHKVNLIEIDNEIIKINGKVKYAINSN